MRKLCLVSILVLVTSMTSTAWNRQGHYAVASIACSTLNQSQRNAIDEILKYHPFYSQWRNEYHKYHPSMTVKEYAFIKAAGWPDDVRSNKWKEKYHRGNWHYVNFPCSPPDKLNTSDPIGSGQLMSKIKEALQSLKDDTSIEQRADRAIMLAWLIHLIGDLHQPLHTVALKNHDYPDGDHGGNFFYILDEGSNPMNLHSFWDQSLGTQKSVAEGKALGVTARKQLPFSFTLVKGNYQDWARESAQIGLDSGYQYRDAGGSMQALEGGVSDDEAIVLPDGYAGTVKKIAMKRELLWRGIAWGVLSKPRFTKSRRQANARLVKLALETYMENEVVAGIIGGVIGGLAGTIGSWLTGYWGPRKLEKEKERREEERVWGPRKRLIKEMLDNPAPSRGRSFKTLKRVTGTPDDDLRRLLVELGARGFTRDDGEEAWDYEERSPLTRHALKDEKSKGLSNT